MTFVNCRILSARLLMGADGSASEPPRMEVATGTPSQIWAGDRRSARASELAITPVSGGIDGTTVEHSTGNIEQERTGGVVAGMASARAGLECHRAAGIPPR